MIHRTRTNNPLPRIERQTNVGVTDCFDQSQNLFGGLNELVVSVSFDSRRSLKIQTYANAVLFKTGSDVLDAFAMTLKVLLERSRFAVRLNSHATTLGVECRSQIHDRFQLLAGRNELGIGATEVDRQVKRPDIHFCTLQKLASELFAECIVAANEICHIDLNALESVSQREFNQFVLATGNTESF